MVAKRQSAKTPETRESHSFAGVPKDFWPWKANISPSALYSCSLPLRKRSGKKTPETKWKNMKRWTEQLASGEFLPEGVYVSEKRQELFIPTPDPRFERVLHVLVLLPYGNVETIANLPESYLMEVAENGQTHVQNMVDHDAKNPIQGYFAACLKYKEENPDQVGIHLKRMKKSSIRPLK